MMTRSWILLAIAFASKNSLVDLNRISAVADGINISVPTDLEMQASISWLIKRNMVVQFENNYKLSKLGKQLVTKAQTKTKMIQKILENLETLLQDYHD